MLTTCQPITALNRRYTLSHALAVGLFILCCYKVGPLGQSANTREVTTQPLRYRTIVSEPSVCMNDSISLELELENTSDHRVLVNPAVLLHRIDISREGGAIQPTGDSIGKISPEQFVALEPGQSYRKTRPYLLKDKFFTTGLYSIRLTYGQFADPSSEFPDLYKGIAESNAVLFEIKDCD
jgi:hypothetical protein